MRPAPNRDTVSQTLSEITARSGDRAALEERLYSRVYPELRALAASVLRSERPSQTLQPTELVHEAYMRLVAGDKVSWEGRAHFFGSAARAMRQILVDHARRRHADKRGGNWVRITLHPDIATSREPDFEILALNDCLGRMEALDARMAQVVELRVFGGMTVREAACVLGVSERTVNGDWSVAKKWLRRELEHGS